MSEIKGTLSGEELVRVIQMAGESSDIDAKGPVSWDGAAESAGLAKDIAAFANSSNGGIIVIGKKEEDGKFDLVGLTEEQAATFDTTKVAQWVNNRFSPPIRLVCYRQEVDGKQLVVIEVREFDNVPAICTKSFQCPKTNTHLLREKTIYVRTANAASAPVGTADELRALIGLATKKRHDEMRAYWDVMLRGSPLARVERARDSTSTVPGANPNFVGRVEELRRLRELLAMHQVGAVVAVNGIGGIGKSALAFQYAQAFAHEYPGGRFLVDTSAASDLRVPIVNLAPHLDITLTEAEQKDLDVAFAHVRATLEQRPTCLLLLDNVDDAGLLAPAQRAQSLPAGERVHVLVTTRLEPAKLTGLQCLALDALAEPDALKLLERYRPIGDDMEWKAALRIVHRLGGHALALEVVAVYLWQNEVGYADYLARLEEEGLAALDAAGEDPSVQISRHPEKLLGRLLEPTLQGLSSAELLVLEYAAVLPPDRVALPWLRELAGRTIPKLVVPPRLGYPDDWSRLIRRLGGLQFFRDTDDPRLVRVHRLVQDVVCARMGAGRREELQEETTTIAGQRAEFLKEGWLHRENRWEIEPLWNYVLLRMQAADVDASSIASGIANRLENLARYNEARDLLHRAIAIQEKAFEPDHPNLATSYTNLATVEMDLGNLTEARDLMHRAIAIEQKAFEPDHPDLATSYSNLAVVEKALGNLTEARDLLHRAIAIDKKAFEPDHPTLATGYSNLALVERDLGNLTEARDLLHRAVAIAEKAFEPDHPNIAAGYLNLALVERSLGNLTEARDLLHRAIAIAEKAFEPDHPKLATSYSNLAGVEQDLGNLTEARDLLHRAIAIQEKAFEPDHPDLATSYSNLATVERDLGNLTAARDLLHRAIAIWEKAFEPDHPILATGYSNLALVERNLGNLTEALDLLYRATAIQQKAFEPDHPTLATTYAYLAGVEKDLGNLTEARDLLHRAIAIQEKAFEPDNPTIAIRYSTLAGVEQDLGNLTEARDLLHRAIAIWEKAFEPDHPILATGYSNLAGVEQALGNLTEARDLLHRAIAIDKKAIEPDHPNLATSYSNLAGVEQDLGNLTEARDLLHRAIAIDKKAFEPDHPNLAAHYSTLAGVERDLGNLTEARDLLHRAIAIEEKAFEPDHPNLATSYSNLAGVEQALGNLTEARDLLHRAIAIDKKAFEPDHPNLATSYSNLAGVEQDLGNLTEARQWRRQAYQIFCVRLGKQHRSTQALRRWLIENDPDFPDEEAMPGGGDASRVSRRTGRSLPSQRRPP